MYDHAAIVNCVQKIKAQLPKTFDDKPLGLILGTGLSDIAGDLETTILPFKDLPHFPYTPNPAQAGLLQAGFLGAIPCIALVGRVHIYEGFSAQEVCFGVRVLKHLGVETLIVTNCAGALNPKYNTPCLFLAYDQINFTGQSPLMGPNDDSLGPRFPDLTQAFDKTLIHVTRETALELGIPLELGVYIGVHGPELETPAETRLYRSFGADAIGMSSVLEVICARHMGLKVLELSCLANKNLPDCMQPITLEEVVANTQKLNGQLATLISHIAPKIMASYS
ncbi:MAG: purine-nucleoside phosphorylase [Desulfovibrionaceae bacterium]|nr:purine-nucleoside phosphorylase [Desulfovibrionaceae bacterium]